MSSKRTHITSHLLYLIPLQIGPGTAEPAPISEQELAKKSPRVSSDHSGLAQMDSLVLQETISHPPKLPLPVLREKRATSQVAFDLSQEVAKEVILIVSSLYRCSGFV